MVICKVCKKEITKEILLLYPSIQSHRKCCSLECLKIHLNNLQLTTIKNCLICGNEFNSVRITKFCCSIECEKVRKSKYDESDYIDNYNEYLDSVKLYRRTDKFRILNRKRQAIRKRNFGFNTLNEFFRESCGHHINTIDVIYIPKSYHFHGQC